MYKRTLLLVVTIFVLVILNFYNNHNSLENKIYNIIFLFTVLLLTYYIYRLNINYNKKEDIDKLNSQRLNLLYSKLNDCSNLKQICDASIEFLVKQMEAGNGILYIVNSKNRQLNLASTCNISQKHVSHILEYDDGVFGEVLKSKEINIIGDGQRIKIDFGSFKAHAEAIVTIPFVDENRKVIAIAQLNFLEQQSSYLGYENILNIITSNIIKYKNNEEYEKYFNLINKYVITSSTNLDGVINFASEAFSKISGYSKDELMNQSHGILKHDNVDEELYKDLWKTIKSGKVWSSELPNKNKNGDTYWVKATISPEFGFYGEIIGYNSIREDITDKKIIENISNTDALTSLYNRRYFNTIFPKQLDLARRLDKSLVFCILDIDYFKQYNDSYGHQEGDKTLQKVANSIKTTLKRDTDYIFRLGGEEFGVIFFTKNNTEAYKLVDQIRTDIEKLKIPHINNKLTSIVTISIGMYIYQNSNLSDKQIYKQTDDLLYKAKKDGRNRIIKNDTKIN